MEIDKAVRTFADFLNSSWDLVNPFLIDRPYTSNESSISDWLQVNWEILVERKVLSQDKYLEVYGDGADYFGASSRMTDIEAFPTFSVKIMIGGTIVNDLLNNETVVNTEFTFDKLVGFKNGFYVIAPPFDYVLIIDHNGTERVFELENIYFKLKKV